MVRLQLSGVEKLETKVISHFDEDDNTGEDDSWTYPAKMVDMPSKRYKVSRMIYR